MDLNLKKLAGEKATDYIKDGMIVGLGTGSTTHFFIKKIGEEIKKGLDIIAIPTSLATEKLAKNLKIPLSNLSDYQIIDITVDGADQGRVVRSLHKVIQRDQAILNGSRLDDHSITQV